MRVLVTGGAGYIGSITSEVLLNRGYDVVVFDNLSQGHRAAVPADAEWVQGDLASVQEIREAIDQHRPDAVMHFAARSLVGESMDEPFAYLRDNVMNGLNLLDACVAGGVERFILSSTANLFGAPTSAVIDEQAPIAPGSPYGESKWALERALDWLSQTKGLRFASLRYFNAAGASEAEESTTRQKPISYPWCCRSRPVSGITLRSSVTTTTRRMAPAFATTFMCWISLRHTCSH